MRCMIMRLLHSLTRAPEALLPSVDRWNSLHERRFSNTGKSSVEIGSSATGTKPKEVQTVRAFLGIYCNSDKTVAVWASLHYSTVQILHSMVKSRHRISGVAQCCIWARFLSLARSKLRLCSANHRAGYFSNLACDWLSIVWAYSEQETENGPWLHRHIESKQMTDVLQTTLLNEFSWS